jgi:hypothetical protein
MFFAVRKRNIGPVVVAQRGRPALKRFESLFRQRSVDGSHPVRPLRVRIARVMIEKGWMCNEDRCHLSALNP